MTKSIKTPKTNTTASTSTSNTTVDQYVKAAISAGNADKKLGTMTGQLMTIEGGRNTIIEAASNILQDARLSLAKKNGFETFSAYETFLNEAIEAGEKVNVFHKSMKKALCSPKTTLKTALGLMVGDLNNHRSELPAIRAIKRALKMCRLTSTDEKHEQCAGFELNFVQADSGSEFDHFEITMIEAKQRAPQTEKAEKGETEETATDIPKNADPVETVIANFGQLTLKQKEKALTEILANPALSSFVEHSIFNADKNAKDSKATSKGKTKAA